MRNEVMWAIRDTQGLTPYEKLFLFTVETRGTMQATWQRAAKDMGFGKDTFYRTRTSLIEKNLILSERMFNGVSSYKVNPDSLTENGWATDSLTANKDSLTENEDSLRPETKKNIKKNKKKNTRNKEEHNGASAPVEPKDESKDEPESSFEEIVTPLLDDAAFSLKQTAPAPSESKAQQRERERQLAEARREQVLRDMGIDPDKEWPE